VLLSAGPVEDDEDDSGSGGETTTVALLIQILNGEHTIASSQNGSTSLQSPPSLPIFT
jgi:hypothetical protein